MMEVVVGVVGAAKEVAGTRVIFFWVLQWREGERVKNNVIWIFFKFLEKKDEQYKFGFFRFSKEL